MVTATRGYSNPSPQEHLPIDNTGSGYLVAAASGKIVRLYRMALTVSAATTVTFYDAEGGTALSGPFNLLANGSIVLDGATVPGAMPRSEAA